MAAKKNNHVVMGDNCFQCLNCGRKQALPMPIDTGMFGAMAKEFEKQHKTCEKTWTPPINEVDGKTEEENANWWAVNGEHGMSSKTMFNCLIAGLPVRPIPNNRYQTTPSDPDDFKRCYLLLKAVPQWKGKLHLLKPLSPVWSKLVDNWDKLTEMYEQNVREDWKNYKKVGMYDFMKSIGC